MLLLKELLSLSNGRNSFDLALLSRFFFKQKYLVVYFLFAVSSVAAQDTDKRIRTLLVIFDGLRPDYITPEIMPNVFAFKKSGGYGREHHSVFPTVTRVNASSYTTGSYPRRHGLMGNTVYFPEVDSIKGLNTGDVHELMRIQKATNNQLLTTVSLGDVLRAAGTNFMVFSSGSSGQAYVQDPAVSGGVVNPGVILPESLKNDLLKRVGIPPPNAEPNIAQHAWAARALFRYGFAPNGPLVSAIWFSDPDGTAHKHGIGSPLAIESIKAVDAVFGSILRELEEKKLTSFFNIVITADHGFVTEAGTKTLGAFLVERGLKKASAADDVVLAGNAIYVKDHDPVLIKKIVLALQEQPWAGAIFTRAAKGRNNEGWVEGTLSFGIIHWDHPARTADILVDYNWDNGKNAFGYEGRSISPGVAGHGGSSPYEIHIPLIVSGPGFKKNYESAVPTSNVDIVPTILHLSHLPIPSQMEGRVMMELLSEDTGKQPRIKREIVEAKATSRWGTYHLVLERSVLGKYDYINYTRVERTLSGHE